MMSASTPTLSEVSAMFGVDPSAPDEVKRRVTSALLLPLSYDIARMLRGDREERAQGRRRDAVGFPTTSHYLGVHDRVQ
jgi:hypothetical protein